MPHFTIKRLPEPDHPRDLSGTAHRPHVVTSTALSAWRNGRGPLQAEAVRRRLEGRHLEQAPPLEYVWLMGTGGVLVDEGSLRMTCGRHHVIYAAPLPPAQMVLARIQRRAADRLRITCRIPCRWTPRWSYPCMIKSPTSN